MPLLLRITSSVPPRLQTIWRPIESSKKIHFCFTLAYELLWNAPGTVPVFALSNFILFYTVKSSLWSTTLFCSSPFSWTLIARFHGCSISRFRSYFNVTFLVSSLHFPLFILARFEKCPSVTRKFNGIFCCSLASVNISMLSYEYICRNLTFAAVLQLHSVPTVGIVFISVRRVLFSTQLMVISGSNVWSTRNLLSHSSLDQTPGCVLRYHSYEKSCNATDLSISSRIMRLLKLENGEVQQKKGHG